MSETREPMGWSAWAVTAIAPVAAVAIGGAYLTVRGVPRAAALGAAAAVFPVLPLVWHLAGERARKAAGATGGSFRGIERLMLRTIAIAALALIVVFAVGRGGAWTAFVDRWDWAWARGEAEPTAGEPAPAAGTAAGRDAGADDGGPAPLATDARAADEVDVLAYVPQHVLPRIPVAALLPVDQRSGGHITVSALPNGDDIRLPALRCERTRYPNGEERGLLAAFEDAAGNALRMEVLWDRPDGQALHHAYLDYRLAGDTIYLSSISADLRLSADRASGVTADDVPFYRVEFACDRVFDAPSIEDARVPEGTAIITGEGGGRAIVVDGLECSRAGQTHEVRSGAGATGFGRMLLVATERDGELEVERFEWFDWVFDVVFERGDHGPVYQVSNRHDDVEGGAVIDDPRIDVVGRTPLAGSFVGVDFTCPP